MGRKGEHFQSPLFAPSTAKAHEPLVFGDYEQAGLPIEVEKPREITIENLVVASVPEIKNLPDGGKEWRCGFSAPSDLWHQERDELVEARASAKETIAMAKEKRLKQGDMVTLTGFVTLQQLLTRGVQVTQLTHINISDVRVELRAAKNPLYVKPRR